MVAFEATRMKDISRSQLVSACRSLKINIGADKSKAATIPFVAEAMMREGIVQVRMRDTPDNVTRNDVKKAKSF